MSIAIQYYQSPVGELILGSYDGGLCLADWRYRKRRDAVDQRVKRFFDCDYTEEPSPVVDDCIQALEAYFKGELQTFTVPLRLAGSDFQQKVWQALIKIPFGQTETYLGLSKSLGNPKAIRAVAAANGANAISILVPCHRIIGSDGSLIGYAGGLLAKKRLLELEGSIQTDQLALF